MPLPKPITLAASLVTPSPSKRPEAASSLSATGRSASPMFPSELAMRGSSAA
jgi:hypothetical protein